MNEETFCISAKSAFPADEISEVAFKVFGIRTLYPYQRLVIANIMDAAKDEPEVSAESDDDTASLNKQIVLLPTGAGKSLCFQVPALLLPGATLVIYPLLALMSDQERRMNAVGIKCAILRGGQSAEEREGAFAKIESGAKIVIANPEILAVPEICMRLKKCALSHIAIDEAHCVSEWGDTFRPAYLELGKIISELAAPVVTAFTATASPEVLERISSVLFGGEAHIVRSESDRPNIRYCVCKVAAKRQAIVQLVPRYERPMIIFCGTRGATEETARDINLCFGRGSAYFYHAGLERAEKKHVENWFFQSTDGLLCATCAYGMGVDKPDIRTIIHLDAPETVESYVQEAGRAGRDGKTANAILLWNQDDCIRFAAVPHKSRRRVMPRFAETSECRRQVLLDALGGENAVCCGCDICDTQRGVFSPAAHIPDACAIVLKCAARRNGLYARERFEEEALRLLNMESRRTLGHSIWNHEAFERIFRQLVSETKLKIGRGAWNGRVCTAEKHPPTLLSIILHRARSLFPVGI